MTKVSTILTTYALCIEFYSFEIITLIRETINKAGLIE